MTKKMIEIPMLETLDVAEAPALLAKYLANPDQEPVILTAKGKPFAVVVPTKGGDVENISVGLSPQFHAVMERSRESYYKDGGIPIEEVRREFGLPPYQEKPKRKPRKKAANRKRRSGTDGSQV